MDALPRSDPSASACASGAMTNNATQTGREPCLAAGMNDHVTPRARVDELIGALQWTTNRKEK
jgi:CheY-like chemotaxis protein